MKFLPKILFLLTLSLCAFVPLRLAVKAAITNSSRVIPYQGRLTDSGGNNVVDGSYAMTFKIYTVSSGGSPSFTEAHSSVSVSSGLFSVLLGSLSASGVNLDFANPPYYLGITIASNSEMSPRIQLGFVPLATNSQYLDGTPLSSFAMLASPTFTGSVTMPGTGIWNSSGNVGIGTTNPGALLQVENATGEVARFVGNATANTRVAIGNVVGYGYVEAKQNNTSTVLPLALNPSGGNVGIGTTNPANSLDVRRGITVANTDYSYAVAGSAMYMGQSVTSGNTYSQIQAYSNGAAAANSLALNPLGGNVGIGTTGPTVQFERVCPDAFTNIKAGNNQLGCMETAEHGTGSWYTAVDTCFTSYGGRLPIYSEWYVAMNNFTLTGETGGNWEWLGSSDYYSQTACAMVGLSTLTDPNTDTCSSTRQYRCWIPR